MNPLADIAPGKGQLYTVDLVPYNVALGLRYVESSAGRLVLDLPWRADLTRDGASGAIHDAAVIGLVDATAGAAVESYLPVLGGIATMDLRTDQLRWPRPGADLRCEAQCYHLGNNVARTRMLIIDGDARDPVATGVGTFVVHGPEAPHVRFGDASMWTAIAPDAAYQPAGKNFADFMGLGLQHEGDSVTLSVEGARRLMGNANAGLLHGGALGGLLHLAAIAQLMDAPTVTQEPRLVNFTVEYLRVAQPVATFARATITRIGRRFASLQARAWQGDASKPLLTANFLFQLDV